MSMAFAVSAKVSTEGDNPKFKSFVRRVYSSHHQRRFEWLRRTIRGLGKSDISIFELGCGEARSIDYIPVRVRRYLGFDAGWGSSIQGGGSSGLEAARRRFSKSHIYQFRQSSDLEDVLQLNEQFDLAIVMETFEYLPSHQLESYIAAIASKLRPDGYLLASLPNEKGIPVVVKWLGAKLSGVPRSRYSLHQLADAAIGRLHRVARAERGRKGFDYHVVARLVQKHLPFVRLEGIGSKALPPALNLNVGLIATRAHTGTP